MTYNHCLDKKQVYTSLTKWVTLITRLPWLHTEELHKIHMMCFTWKRSLKCWFRYYEDVVRLYTKPTKTFVGNCAVHQLGHAVVFQYRLKLNFRQKKDFKVVFKNVQVCVLPRQLPLMKICPKTLGVHDSCLAYQNKNFYNHTHAHIHISL